MGQVLYAHKFLIIKVNDKLYTKLFSYCLWRCAQKKTNFYLFLLNISWTDKYVKYLLKIQVLIYLNFYIVIYVSKWIILWHAHCSLYIQNNIHLCHHIFISNNQIITWCNTSLMWYRACMRMRAYNMRDATICSEYDAPAMMMTMTITI